MGSGAWDLVHGIWCMGSGAWDLVHGIWCMGSGAWDLVHGIWCMGSGAWDLVHGIWCMRSAGAWDLVHEIWCISSRIVFCLLVTFHAMDVSSLPGIVIADTASVNSHGGIFVTIHPQIMLPPFPSLNICSWYYGSLTRREARIVLQDFNGGNGSFIVRASESFEGKFAVSFV